MIRVNLGKKRRSGGGLFGGLDLGGLSLDGLLGMFKRGGASGGGGGGGGDALKTGIKHNPLIKAVVAALLVAFINYEIENLKLEDLAAEQAKIQAVSAEKDRVDQKLAQIRGYEPIKKQLEQDEAALRLKIAVLTRLMDNRKISARLMKEVAMVMPAELWLTEMKVTEASMLVNGGSFTHDYVSDFIKSLSASSFFGEVTLKDVKENMTPRLDQRTQQFELMASRKSVY